MDGNYGGTMELRLAAADTIIYLDLPPPLCLWRVFLRFWRYRGRSRPDVAAGCPEKLDWTFLKWIAHYRRDRRPSILERMAQYAEGRCLIHLQTVAQVKRFLDGLPGRE
jgi:adenylate kinase family enzyme